MSNLMQQEGPDQIWIQPMEAEDSGLAEPQLFEENDDWYAGLFNAYFLSIFKKESGGIPQESAEGFSNLKPLLDAYFDDGSLSEIHRQVCNRWYSEQQQSGIWFSVSWKDFQYEDSRGRALGFYYSAEEEVFLQLGADGALVRTGLPLKKPGFACLFFRDETGAYRMFQQSPQPGFWSAELFPFVHKADDAFHSKEFFKLCKSFSEDVLLKEQHKSREEQIGFLADSLSYTKEKQEVSFDEFRTEVLKEPSLIDAFDQYREDYSDRKQWNPPDKFAVSSAVQNQAGKFIRSVIKLDKNFHIYVHGSKERIEKGFDDEKKLNYYTLWFDAEN